MIAWLPVLAAVALGWGLDRLFAGGAAVYVLPLACGGIALTLYGWRRRPRVAGVLAAIVALAIMARYLQQWSPEVLWGTNLDANLRATFERICQLAPGHPPRTVRVGVSWLFEPSMNSTARRATPPGWRLTFASAGQPRTITTSSSAEPRRPPACNVADGRRCTATRLPASRS